MTNTEDPRYDGKHPVCKLCNGHGATFSATPPPGKIGDPGRPVHVLSATGPAREYWCTPCPCEWSESLARRGEMVWLHYMRETP